MTAVTVAQLAADSTLRLRVLVGDSRLDRFVRGAHISDLDHPARYLLPGELVLTNGLWLEHANCEEWVEQAAGAGAVAIGFGLSQARPQVPVALLQACQASSLALLEVPEDLSFSAIAECVREHNKTDDASARLQLMRLRRLLQSLACGGGPAAVLDMLRRETRLPIWLVGPGGRSLTDEQPPDGDAARSAARAARRGLLPCAVGPRISAFGPGADALSSMAVVVGVPLAEVGDDARLAIEQAGAYLVLGDARRRERDNAREAQAEELVELVWSGELSAGTLSARLHALGLSSQADLLVLTSSNSADAVSYAAIGCRAPCVCAARRASRLLLVQSYGEDDEHLVDEVAELIRDAGEEPVLGSARASVSPDGLRQALAESIAAQQLASTRPTGERVVRRLGVGSHRLLLGFLDPRVLRAYRDAVLGPVERWDVAHDSQLLDTLAAFMDHDGRWRRTATALHIHHNTLHYRLNKVSELTGRAVSSTVGRLDLALALAIPADAERWPRRSERSNGSEGPESLPHTSDRSEPVSHRGI